MCCSHGITWHRLEAVLPIQTKSDLETAQMSAVPRALPHYLILPRSRSDFDSRRFAFHPFAEPRPRETQLAIIDRAGATT